MKRHAIVLISNDQLLKVLQPNDVIAGLTLGIMLVPQSLAYAKIATIPVQFGLMSSWFPATLYAFMGTTKDLSTGPTSLIGLLTAEVVADLTKEGYSPQVSPWQITTPP